MGSATLFHLARRGTFASWPRALHGRALAFGSSHGDSRIIRETYFEHPLYVPLVQSSPTVARAGEVSGGPLMTITGGLMIGRATGWSSRAH